MNRQSVESGVAFSAYAPTGAFWWTLCSIPFFYLVEHTYLREGELFIYTVAAGVTSSLAIKRSLTLAGLSGSRVSARLAPIFIGVVCGTIQAAVFAVPLLWGFVSGAIYPYWLIPSATRIRRRMLAQAQSERAFKRR
jgi:hypothetical protein